jgi:drug/metabolite transporter (DMT)-like permease
VITRLTAVAGVLGISFAAIFVSLADVEPVTATTFRALLALPFLAVAAAFVRKRDGRPSSMRGLAFASGLLLSIDVTLFNQTIDLIGAGLATLLANTQVLFVGAIAWALHRERPTKQALITVPVVLVGVAFVSGLGRADAFGEDPVAGVLFGLATGAAYALFLLAFRASNRRYLAPTAGPLFDATAGMAAGSLVLGVVIGGLDLNPGLEALAWLLALAVIAQTVGWLLISVALPRLAALDTSILLLVQPAAALVWAYLILSEDLSALQWVGVALVFGGIGWLSLQGAAARLGGVDRQAPVLADPA